MTDVKVELKGFEELGDLLKLMPERVEKRVAKAAVRSALTSAKSAIKNAAPTHLDKQSPASQQYGTLKSNIRILGLKRNPRGQVGARIDTGNAFWGLIYEIGSRYQAAKPWFAPAFRSASQAIIDKLGERLGAGIEKEAKKK